MGKCAYFLKKTALLFLFAFVFFSLKAQIVTVKNAASKDVLVIDLSTGIIAETDSNAIVYTIKGNSIFSGNSNRHEDILFMLNTTDLYLKKGGKLLLKENNETIFSFSRGSVWLGASTTNKALLIGKFEKVNTTRLNFRLASNNEILFSTNAAISAAQAMATLSFFVVTNDIDKQLIEAANIAASQTPALGTGTIRRLWGDGNEEFIWDGKILRNRWRINEYEQWTFDGNYIYRAWFDTGEMLEWDGKTLRSNFAGNNMFVQEGNTLRTVFGTGNEEFFIQGNIIKRSWVAVGNDEWEVNGNIPIPIIMMVVFRLAR